MIKKRKYRITTSSWVDKCLEGCPAHLIKDIHYRIFNNCVPVNEHAHDIDSAFTWRRTNEGSDFWACINAYDFELAYRRTDVIPYTYTSTPVST